MSKMRHVFRQVFNEELEQLILCAASHNVKRLRWYRGILFCSCYIAWRTAQLHALRLALEELILKRWTYDYLCYAPHPYKPIVRLAIEGVVFTMSVVTFNSLPR